MARSPDAETEMNVLPALALLELTLREIVNDVPRDSGAAVALLVIALFVGFVWHGSRRHSAQPAAATHADAERDQPSIPE